MKLLDRTFGILKIIAATPAGIGVTDLAQQVGLAKSTTSRILSALEEREVVVRSAENRFTIGPTITLLAAQQPFARSLEALAQPVLQQIVEETGEAAALCVQDGRYAKYVAQVQGPQAVQVLDWTGSRIPLHVLAAGKVFLAYASADFIDSYFKRPLAQYTPSTILSADKLHAELAAVRANRFAYADEEFAEAITGFAVPIFDRADSCVAALNVFGPKFRLESAEKRQHIVASMHQHAATLMNNL